MKKNGFRDSGGIFCSLSGLFFIAGQHRRISFPKEKPSAEGFFGRLNISVNGMIVAVTTRTKCSSILEKKSLFWEFMPTVYVVGTDMFST